MHAITPVNEVLIDPLSGDGFGASFFWNGGIRTIRPVNNCCGGMDYGSGINRSIGPSRYFGWQVSCQASPCGGPFQALDVRGVDLIAVDTTPPTVSAVGSNSIFNQAGRWIRGSGWPASFSASADDGICNMREIIDGNVVQGPFDFLPNQHSWTQCPGAQTMAQTIDTTAYPNGPLPLTLPASDAASPANVSSPSTTMAVDKVPVSVSLTGPADALSTAGTQYVSVTTAAGPSGVAAIYCSVDGGPSVAHAGATAEIPVSGIGSHEVSCFAQNNAIDPGGRPASSPTETFVMSIRQPVAAAITFSRIANSLRCHKTKLKERGAARIVKRHGRKVKVRGRVHVTTVMRCHARTAMRKVTMIEHRHGKAVVVKRLKRVVLLPHVVDQSKLRVAYGKGATVSGLMVLGDGSAPLAGRAVQVLAAPDNGLGQFAAVATVMTGADGSWSAALPAGPSRLIEAVYAGVAVLLAVALAR